MMTLNSYSLKHRNSSTQPYVYYVYHRPSGKYYLGSRTAQGCHPSDLWRTYFTSSKRVHKLIEESGKESFTAICWERCKSREEALALEFRLLKTVIRDPKCLNLTAGNVLFSGTLPGTPKSAEYRQKQSERLKGKPRSENWIESHSKTWKLTSPAGDVSIVHNLQRWCRENKHLGLYPQNLRSVARGLYKTSKGYRCEYYSGFKQ